MNRDEVGEFYKYIQDLYRLPGIETTQAYGDWCEAFKNMSFEQGKNIVKAFGRENTDKPTLPVLMKYRDSLYPRYVRRKMLRCDLCNGSGAIFVEKEIIMNERFPENSILAQYVYRCTCENGMHNFSAFPLINNDVVRGKHRDISNIWRVDEPSVNGDKNQIDVQQLKKVLKESCNFEEINNTF